MVRSRLSQRGAPPRRTGGRASRVRKPINLEDRPLSDDDGWVPADEHERKTTTHDNTAMAHPDDEYEDITDDERHHTQNRNLDERTESARNGTQHENRSRAGEGLVADD
jgi:hypothetical protein